MTWLAGWDYGEPVQVVDVQQFPADPEYVEITQEVEVVRCYFRTTGRLRKDRLVACVTAKAITCGICGKPILASGAYRPCTGPDCRCTRPGLAPRTYGGAH